MGDNPTEDEEILNVRKQNIDQMESIRKKNARFQDYWDKKYKNKKGETLRGTSWTKLEPFRNPSISDSNLEYGRPIISKDIDFYIDGNIKFETPESVDVLCLSPIRKTVTFAGSDKVIITPTTTDTDSQ